MITDTDTDTDTSIPAPAATPPPPAVFPGKPVFYVLDAADAPGDGSLPGQTRAAFIIRAIGVPDAAATLANLAVLLDGTNDSPHLPYPGTLLHWLEAVPYDPNGTPGTWREAE